MKASLVAVLVVVLAVGALATGCISMSGRTTIEGSGVAATETRTIAEFTGISIEGSGDAVVLFGDEPSIVVEADENLLEYIETEVEGNTLYLRLRHPEKGVSFRTRSPLRYTITTPSVSAFSIAGSGSVHCAKLAAEELGVEIAGSGTVVLNDMRCGKLEIDIAGSGDVRMSGVAESQWIQISGSGDVAAGDLRTKKTRIDIAGSGDATIWATERLRVSVAGSGDVQYYGSPSLSKSIDGMGSVRHLGDKGAGSGDV